jgi:uncharacterized membrane protein (UPF0127 family)
MFRTLALPNGCEIHAEIAIEPEDLTRGLMFRERLAPDEGMLFIHSHVDFYPVWMRSTLIPLDILWLAHDGTIVELACGAQPCKTDDCPRYGGMRASSFTLEVSAGTIKRNGLKCGQRITWVRNG